MVGRRPCRVMHRPAPRARSLPPAASGAVPPAISLRSMAGLRRPSPPVGRPCPASTTISLLPAITAPGNAGGSAPDMARGGNDSSAPSGAVSLPSGSPSIAGAGGSGPARGTRQDVESALSPHGGGVSAPRLHREAQGSLLGVPTHATCSMSRADPAKLNVASTPCPEQAEPARACFLSFLSFHAKERNSPADKRAKTRSRVRDPRPPQPGAERAAGRARGLAHPTGLGSPARRGPALTPGAEPT